MFTNPENNAAQFGFMPGQTVADFGSGSGHVAFALSKELGEHGSVIAIDLQEDLLVRLKNLAGESGVKNIDVLDRDLEEERGSGLADSSMDGVVLSNILFQVEDKDAVVKEAFRITKPGGKVCVIDWQEKLGVEDVKKFLTDLGLKEEKVFDAGHTHYGLVFKK